MAADDASFPIIAALRDPSSTFTGRKRIRKSFGRIPEAVQMPNLKRRPRMPAGAG